MCGTHGAAPTLLAPSIPPFVPFDDRATMTLNRRSLIALAAGSLAPMGALVAPAARAADAYPSRPIRWIVAYPAAGGSDFLARQLAPQMGK